MDEFSYISEFPDNISINSDDTDFLLSSNVDKLVLQRDGEVDSDDQDTVCLTTEENYNFTSFTKNNGFDQRSDITDATTADLSFVQRLKSSYKPHVHEISVVTTKTSHDPLMNSMNEEEKEEFEKMDEKVREGQNIINKLLADISRNRSPAKSNTSEVNEEAPSFNTNSNTKHVTKSYDLQSKSPTPEEKPFKSQEDYYEESYHETEANTSRLLKWKLNSSLDNSLQNEVTFLKDELANLEMKKSQEILTLSERTERQISTLQKKLSTTTKEKDLIQEENEQLKESLSKKEHLCLQLQEILNEKSQQIVRMQHQETENRSNLNTEVKNLRLKKSQLENRVSDLEKAFHKQLSKIKEFESQFKEMKEQRDISMMAKEEEIAELKQRNELLKNEMKNVQNDVYTNPEITTLRTQLMREVQKNKQLQQDLRNVDDIHRNLENVKFQLNQHQKLFKSLAIELFEESTKMSVIKGSSPKSPKLTCSSSPGDKEQTNILVNAMKTFKENFDDFRSYTISIQEKLKTQSSLELSQSPSANNSSPTTSISNKLLRHLQNRVQQLRHENIQLKENLKNSSRTVFDTSDITRRVEDLESQLQDKEVKMNEQQALLESKMLEVLTLQHALKQSTKERLRNEKQYADTLAINHTDQSPNTLSQHLNGNDLTSEIS